MNPFTTHRGIVAPLNRANIDTDAIIPKQFLKSIARTGFGPACFFDWRYLPDGKDNPQFELNQPRYQRRSILVVQNNFGCGSSREHAVWALDQDGYRAIIAPRKTIGGDTLPGFADIFRNNTTKNGLLTIELSDEEVQEIFALVNATPGLEATVDLPAQTVTFHAPAGAKVYSFQIAPGEKHILLNGLDDIGMSLQHAAAIDAFEKAHDPQLAKVG
jgi:3-isopropylmalate/(R)-2-methylmalate dehydratase small subunit